MWELLKRFPTLPPFGPTWFGVLREAGHPLADLRIDWILENIWLDRKAEAERREDEIEYGGLFANPELFKTIKEKKLELAGKPVPAAPAAPAVGPIKIVQDTTPFWQLWEQAEAGVDVMDTRTEEDMEADRKERERIKAFGQRVGPVRGGRDTLTDEGIVSFNDPGENDG